MRMCPPSGGCLDQIAECRFPLAHKGAATCKLIPTKTKGIRAGDPLMIPRAMQGRLRVDYRWLKVL